MKKLISENKVCRCHGQTHYGHYGPIMCNTASHGVQAWWAEDCCNKTMDTPEGCWVSSNVGGPGTGGPKKGDEVMIGGGSGFEKPQGGSDRLEKFNKMQMGESKKVRVSLTETELIDYIEKSILSEQHWGAYCEAPNCQCLPNMGGPYTGPGQSYNSISLCLQDTSNCCSDPDQMYSCNEFTGGQCSPDLTGNGQFPSMAACQAANPNGCESKRWDCLANKGNRKFGSKCVEVGNATGKFYTKEECEASKQCAQLASDGKSVNRIDFDYVSATRERDVDGKNIGESHFRRLSRKIINEQTLGFTCEQAPASPQVPCACVPALMPPGPGQTLYQTLVDCQTDTTNCCGNSYGHYECVNGTCTAQAGGQYNTLQDCQGQCGGGLQQWWCMTGVAGVGPCIQSPTNPQPGMATGPFPNQNICMSQCTMGQQYDCVNGTCQQMPGGQYNTLADCQTACTPTLTWKCKNKGNHPKFGKHCVEVQSGGDFATKAQCQASKQCAQLHDKGINQYDMDIDVLNKKGSMVKYEPDGSSTSSYGKETRNLRETDLKRLINKVSKERILKEGPICGSKSGEPCGKCGDGYAWTDSHVTNSCICNHSNGKVCHSTGSAMYGNTDKIKGGIYNPNTNSGIKFDRNRRSYR